MPKALACVGDTQRAPAHRCTRTRNSSPIAAGAGNLGVQHLMAALHCSSCAECPQRGACQHELAFSPSLIVLQDSSHINCTDNAAVLHSDCADMLCCTTSGLVKHSCSVLRPACVCAASWYGTFAHQQIHLPRQAQQHASKRVSQHQLYMMHLQRNMCWRENEGTASQVRNLK